MNRYACGAAGLAAGLVVGAATQAPYTPFEPMRRSGERVLHVLFFGVVGLAVGVAVGLMMERRAADFQAAQPQARHWR